MTPLYGLYISNIRKIAPDTDNAAVNNVATTVALRGANSPQLTKTMVSQKTIMTTIGLDTEVAPCTITIESLRDSTPCSTPATSSRAEIRSLQREPEFSRA